MTDHSFFLWLFREAEAEKWALLSLYEKRDDLLFTKRAMLEQRYMEAVGEFEEDVLREEMEAELLKRKKQKIQIAINRQEPLDEEAIDAVLEAERQQMMQEAAGEEDYNVGRELSCEQRERLKELHQEIVRAFHPQLHPDLTEVHQELFQKAQEAYQKRDLEALELVHEILCPKVGAEVPLKISLRVEDQPKEASKEEIRGQTEGTDYALAAQIYREFQPTEEEVLLFEERERYRKLAADLEVELDRLRLEFPFNAQEMLASPEKVREYKEGLIRRLNAASDERKRLEGEIRAMLGKR